MIDLEETRRRIDSVRASLARLEEVIGRHFLGQEGVAQELLLCLLAGGHALLEGAPGLGKTTLVRSLAASLSLAFRRVQFTPDLMPPDILGTRILEASGDGERRFRFERGPIFTHVLLADEINRATPRTQSALLEAMQERQVTIFGHSHALERPFLVIATQNPIEMEGTYPLPEAQLDRFLFKIEISMPERAALAAILTLTTGESDPPHETVLEREDVLEMAELTRAVPVASDVVQLVSDLVLATHPTDRAPERVRAFVRHGASPRGGQALLVAAKARALLHGRLHVAVQDVEALAAPALRHRLILGYEGEASGVHPDELVADALAAVRR